MLKITKLLCDHKACNEYKYKHSFIENATPGFTWILESDENNVYQDSYRIIVTQRNNGELMWDSGKVFSDESANITYSGKQLLPLTQYDIALRVTAKEAAAELISDFETGMLTENPFSAKWIYSGKKNKKDSSDPIHVFSKEIKLCDKEIVRARAFASSMGIFFMRFNGEKVSDEYFAPGNSNYKKHIQFVEYNVDDLVANKAVSVEAYVANGWYLGRVDLLTNYYGNCRAFIFELHVWYKDGTKDIIKSDDSWSFSDDSPFRFAEFYDGEVYDANLSVKKYAPVALLPEKNYSGKKLIAHMGVPVVSHEEIIPERVFTNTKGELIYDFGQNFAGFVSIKTDCPKGTVLTVSHAEILMGDEEFYTENLRYAKAQLKYTCKGGGEQYRPSFTSMGFRYAKVEGIKEGNVELTGIVLHSMIEKTGDFSCSNTKLTKLQHNIVWSAKSNFIDIPTDCPQRDERLGWTGDITVFSSTAAFNYDITLFMRKWLYDLESEQVRGIVPFCVPDVGCLKKEKTPTSGWSDAATFVPWAVYLSSGDKEVLSRSYNSMKAWVDCEKRLCNDRLIWEEGFQFGDWLAPDGGYPVWRSRAKWLASCYFAKSAEILSKAAEILGKRADAKKYAKLKDDIKQAFVNEFIKDGHIENGFQSAYVCALWFKMLSDKQLVDNAVADLLDTIKKNNGLLNTGFLGTPFLTFALSDYGCEKEAYSMLQNEECPSWLYPVNCGATTIWERWDGIRTDGSVHIYQSGSEDNMVSFNHYAYGAVGDFLYKRVCGLDIITPGYKSFSVKPIINGNLTSAYTSHICPYGEIKVGWKKIDGVFTLELTVPVNTTAQVEMPSGNKATFGSGTYSISEISKKEL